MGYPLLKRDDLYCIDGINYFMERAKGGAGLIITGANVVSTKYEPRPCTELSDFHHVERLNMLIERCHNYGAKVRVQLSPGLGRQQFTRILSRRRILRAVSRHSGFPI